MSLNVLLIGCGNIGLMYDLEVKEKVWTHAKAFTLRSDVQLTVTDNDQSKLKKFSENYHAIVKEVIDDYSEYDIVSITTPTHSHFSYLKDILHHSVPVVICEKPVVNSIEHIYDLKKIYEASDSKILVNYIRRFQPAYISLKNRIGEILSNDELKGINIKYKRGFLNNASHAIDLIEFLFDTNFELHDMYVNDSKFDAFDYDPTITGSCYYRNVPVSFFGLIDITYPIFEIEFFFGSEKVIVCNSGNEIRYYKHHEGIGLIESKMERQENILDRYMVPVVNEAIELFNKRKSEDNFMSALRINEEVLKVIESTKD
ncbi:MAG: Gfo/Idh/MocA family protein [Flavisolibacter sp.]